MKVLVVHSELGVLRGGGENFTRNLFLSFMALGHDVSAAFVADSRGQYPIPLPGKMRPIPFAGLWSRKLGQETLSKVARLIPHGPSFRGKWDRLQEAICWRTVRWHDRRFSRRVEREFQGRWKEFDAVYVHGSVPLASHVAQHCLTILGLPGPVSEDLAPVLKRIHAVCLNGDALNQVRKFLGDHAVELPLGVNADIFKPGSSQVRERIGWTENNWVIGYVGRLAYIKGVDILADAFKDTRKAIPHARLLIVGSGEEQEKLRVRLRSDLAQGFVHFEPGVPHEFLPDWYRAMDLFVMPSRYENLSNAVLEAMACGVAFLGSNIGGNQTYVEAEGGWVFTPGSVGSLSEKLRFLAENPGLARDRKASIADKVCRGHSWTATAKRLEDILLSLRDKKFGVSCRP